MEEQLQTIGLSELQARAYLYLLDYTAGRKPIQVADALGITRTNTYKLLDSLVEIDLVRKSEVRKTYTYFAENPIALTTFVANARNRALLLESAVKDSLGSLQKRYRRHTRQTEVITESGKAAIVQAYHRQIQPGRPLYFIKSRADVIYMGHQTMHALRTQAVGKDIIRYGLTTDSPEAPTDLTNDAWTGLKRTWLPHDAYTSSVEWMTSGDELAIISFVDNGRVVRIKDVVIADAFRELWHIIDTNVRANPSYASLPTHAARR